MMHHGYRHGKSGIIHLTPSPGSIVSLRTDQSGNVSDMQILRLYSVCYCRNVNLSKLKGGRGSSAATASPGFMLGLEPSPVM